MEALREALKGSDTEAVRTRARELTEVLQRVATAAYQAGAAASEAPSGDGQQPQPEGAGEGEAEPAGAGTGAGEETVEGEYKEV